MPPTNPGPPARGWRVTTQQETTRPDTGGRFTTGVIVSFVTNAGHTGSVFVPDSVYSTDSVRAAVQQRADRLDSVGELAT